MDKKQCKSQDVEVRKGPWTVEEDLILINYIANHGEGVWNALAKASGLERIGKSCQLRWLNYLRPDVRKGNIILGEQLLIMELHAKWGNRDRVLRRNGCPKQLGKMEREIQIRIGDSIDVFGRHGGLPSISLKKIVPLVVSISSLFSRIGDAKVALHRLGIPLKNVVIKSEQKHWSELVGAKRIERGL